MANVGSNDGPVIAPAAAAVVAEVLAGKEGDGATMTDDGWLVLDRHPQDPLGKEPSHRGP